MGRPKAVVQPPPAPNMSAINDILAKARSLVGGVKRSPSDQQLGESPAATKARTAALPTPAKAAAVPPKASPTVAKAAAVPPKSSPPAVPAPPTRLRGKTPDQSVAKPMPEMPPPHLATEVKTPSPKTISPAGSFESSEPLPSQRTRAYLQNHKNARLANADQEALKTPPPKSTLLSPPNSASQPESPWHDSYVDFCASRGESWWATDAGPFGKKWWYDPVKERYVYTKGTQCWISDSEDWYGGWTLQTPENCHGEPSPTPTSIEPSEDGHDARVRDFLAARQPTGLTETSEVSMDVAEDSADQEPNEEESQVPNEKVAVVPHNDLDKTKAPEETEVPQTAGLPGAPNVPAELPAPEAAPPAQPAVAASEAFRLDKHGKPITPEALYMRFYRRLRSVLFAICVMQKSKSRSFGE